MYFTFEKSNIQKAIRSTKYKMKRSGEKGIKYFFKPKRILIDCEEEESVAETETFWNELTQNYFCSRSIKYYISIRKM